MIQDTGQAKVTQLGILIWIKKDIARLQVAVEDSLRALRLLLLGLLLIHLTSVNIAQMSAPMAKVETWNYLRKDFPNEIFFDVFICSEAMFNDLW